MENNVKNEGSKEPKIIDKLVGITSVMYPRGSHGNCWGIVNVCTIEYDGFYNENLVLKGELPEINYGETYKVIAEETLDKYGVSYKIKMMMPYNTLKNNRQWQLFLSTIISPKQVEAIFNTLQDPIRAIEDKNVEELCKVKGIQKITAEKIIKKYEENKIYGEAFAELVKYDISVGLVRKIVDTYGSLNKALNIIKTNPYQLAIDVEGIGFNKADEIGKKIGIPNNDVGRIKSFICYWLYTQAPEGYSWVTPNVLCEIVTSYLNLQNTANLKQALSELKEQGKLCWNLQENYVGLKKYYDLEKNIAIELKRLYDTRREFKGEDFNVVKSNIEVDRGYQFTEEQINAAINCIKEPISIVVGLAGSGKSSSVQLALDTLKTNYKILATSFSGKASYRIFEATGFKGATIHSTLEYNPQFKAFMRNKNLPLNCDIMLIDECSFLDGELFYSLLQALPNGCKLIMLGDPNQLEPIGTCSVFPDMINSGVININRLTKIHRQAAKSGIIAKANEISEGIQISDKNVGVETFGELQDFSLITSNADKLQELTIELFKREYKKYNDINKVQGLTTLRTRGNLSLQILNDKIQQWYNPQKGNDVVNLTRNGKPLQFRVGDKVMNTKNNYNAISDTGDKAILYNGMVGIITHIMPNDNSMIINFGSGVGNIYVDKDWLPNIELAYFCTVFKYQGSECDSCIFTLDMSSFTLLTRNLVYTGLTRAKKNCIMVCESKALKKAIATNNVVKKQTFLKKMLIDIFNKNKQPA